MPYVDANIFLYLIDTNSRKDFREASRSILKRIEEGESASMSAITLMELLWWCEKHAKKRIKDVYDMILSYKNINILSVTASIVNDAMFFKEKYNLELNDCIALAVMASSGDTEMYSNDEGFDRIEWIKRNFG